MKAITLLQPWASLMAVRKWERPERFCKMWETRSWATKYRGPIAIHSSARIPKGTAKLVCESPFFEAFGRPAEGMGGVIVDMAPALPTGVVLGVGILQECIRTEAAKIIFGAATEKEVAQCEEKFGDYSPGRFAWLITDMHTLKTPVPAKGKLGIWDWYPNPEALVIGIDLRNKLEKTRIING